MSPKEQANDLFEIYLLETGNDTFAKNCALVAVDLILEIIDSNYDFKYWQEVKNELEKYDT
jgi:hypothetical protein